MNELPCDHDEQRWESPRDPETFERAAQLLRAAADPARLRLLERLHLGEACVSELAAESGDQLSTISQRLKVLLQARLVVRRREGKHVYYALEDAHVYEFLENVLDHAEEH